MYYKSKGNVIKKGRGVRFDIIAGLIMSVILAFGGQAFSQAKGGGGAALPGDNKQVVTGTTDPCARTTVDTGSVVTLTPSVDADGNTSYIIGATSLRGTLTNCSTSLQAYYIEFTEAPRATVDALNQPTCAVDWSVGDFIMKSGDKRGWSFNFQVTLAPITDITACVGTHTVNVRVMDRTTGALLQTTTATYDVVVK